MLDELDFIGRQPDNQIDIAEAALLLAALDLPQVARPGKAGQQQAKGDGTQPIAKQQNAQGKQPGKVHILADDDGANRMVRRP